MKFVPHPASVVIVGSLAGIALWLQGVLPGRPLHPLLHANVAAVALALLLSEGEWRRPAAGVTLTISIWFALYAGLCAWNWDSMTSRVFTLKAIDVERDAYCEEKLVELPKRAEPQFRALVRAELEREDKARRAENALYLRDALLRETAWRNEFFLALAAGLACFLGAARRLKQSPQERHDHSGSSPDTQQPPSTISPLASAAIAASTSAG